MPDKYDISPTNPETRLTLKLSDQMKQDLKLQVTRDKRDMSEVVRQLIAEYLNSAE